jgi:hypothetical protein
MISTALRILPAARQVCIPWAAALLLVIAGATRAQGDTVPVDSTAQTGPGFRIDQPGTITFTVGVKISGKVEKPQVMIFLPKEKTVYRDEVLSRSFVEELSQPLSFTPVIE